MNGRHFIFKDDMSRKGKIILVAGLFTLAAVFFLLTLLGDFITGNLEKRCTAAVCGTVTEVETTRYRKRVYDSDRPRYRTETRTECHIEVETDDVFRYDSLLSTEDSLKKGDRVTIHYDPHKPEIYYFDQTIDSTGFSGLVFSVLGIICLIGGMIFLFFFFILRKIQESRLY
ncbi:DUF3592 domain-containing protein [uncultured Ruminococcus sp.]|uniref:DUF3592 domain-containing protein n=1 Tax=uncultured Ruminococcus sp. TaxID=165186 RepID=UPI002623665A|nr:DUF3592 domain-containing protein [uncultured Ruminococcus sp.]